MADAILLCKHHHLLMHNNRWEVARREAQYWLIPPPDIDPEQAPRAMPSKSRSWLEFLGEQEPPRKQEREPDREPYREPERELVR